MIEAQLLVAVQDTATLVEWAGDAVDKYTAAVAAGDPFATNVASIGGYLIHEELFARGEFDAARSLFDRMNAIQPVAGGASYDEFLFDIPSEEDALLN